MVAIRKFLCEKLGIHNYSIKFSGGSTVSNRFIRFYDGYKCSNCCKVKWVETKHPQRLV